jgi:hypothetical protein
MAAGLGFKTFTTGEVLTAADTNGYLMQGVLVFASAAARDAAITSPQEGQCCYLKDTDAVLTYSGAAWVGFDDSNAIQNSIVDAKGDLVAASGADTPARLAVGNNGETLVADSSTSTGLRYQGSTAAGKNFVINGAFDNWQRGTTFTNPADGAFTADRMSLIHDGTGATRTISRQALAPASISGFDSQYFYRYAVSAAGTGNTYQRFGTKIENVQNLTGTVTVSFWAKADASRTVSFQLDQYYGSGGSSATVGLQLSSMAAVTTSWQRFSATGTLASISGKTVGDGSYVYAYFAFPANTALTIDIAGFQIENGSVATQFSRSAGTIQGELAACQRYFVNAQTDARFPSPNASGSWVSSIFLPVTMRTTPTVAFNGAATSANIASATLAALSYNNFIRNNLVTTSGSNTDSYYVRDVTASAEL